MKRFIYSCCVALSIVFGVSFVQAMTLNPVGIGSTVEEYQRRFGKNALQVACGHGNYEIAAKLLKNKSIICFEQVKNIEKSRSLEGLDDLCCLLSALRKNKIYLDELVQVLQAFQPAHRKTNRYGESQPVERVRDGNIGLDFTKLSKDLADKVRTILEVTN